jgi:hypothetical protein
MSSGFTRRAARKAAVGAAVALVSLGLGAAGATPALAVGTVTITLAGADQGDMAQLLCLNPTSVAYDWESHGFESADAQATFRFNQAPESATCTVRFTGGGASNQYPAQTIGGFIGSPDGASGYVAFRTDAAGNAGGLVYQLIEPASVTGVVTGVLDAVQTTITLLQYRTDLVTGQVEFWNAGTAQPDARTGEFTITNVTPNSQFALTVQSPGYVRTWWGGSTALRTTDPYDPSIASFTSAGSGATTPVGVISLVASGASIQGQALGFGANVNVAAFNLLTGVGRTAQTTASSYSISGLTEGVYLVEALGTASSYAYGIVAVPAAGSVLLNLTGAQLQDRILGGTYTAIKGSPEVGTTMQAEASTVGQGYGLSISYGYTWITANQILGTGPKLTVPDLAGQDLYVVTVTQPAGAMPGFTVSSANGKILLKSGPKFTVKVTGTLQVGKKIKAVPAKAVKAKAWKKSYQWLRNGKPIAGKAAKKATYKLTKKDQGKKISVQVTVKRQGYTDSAASSKKSAKIKKK